MVEVDAVAIANLQLIEQTHVVDASPVATDKMDGPIGSVLHGDARYLKVAATKEGKHMGTRVELGILQLFEDVGIFQLRSHEGNAIAVDDALARERDVVGPVGPKPEHALAPVVAKGRKRVATFIGMSQKPTACLEVVVDVTFQFQWTRKEGLSGRE